MNNESRVIIGVDPGIHGSIVCLYKTDDLYNILYIMDIIYNKERLMLDTESMLKNILVDSDNTVLKNNNISKYIYVEKVHSLPRDSRQSAFTFGVIFGEIRMFLMYSYFEIDNNNSINEELIPIQRWKSVFNIKKKEEARDIISKYINNSSKLYNELVNIDRLDRIEAALIGISGDILFNNRKDNGGD